jgi:hypothetical protein
MFNLVLHTFDLSNDPQLIAWILLFDSFEITLGAKGETVICFFIFDTVYDTLLKVLDLINHTKGYIIHNYQ